MWEALSDLLDHVERRWKDAGVIVVVDELHNVSSTGMGPVSAAVQELSGAEKRKLAFIGVGLPGLVYAMMNCEKFAFLQRCPREVVGRLGLNDTMMALKVPLSRAGISVEDLDLRKMAAGTSGYGYAIQSAGWHVWNACGGSGRAGARDVDEAIRKMDADVDQRIVAPIWTSLTRNEIEFLMVMSEHEGPVNSASITREMGDSARKYKTQLLHKGIILDVSAGLLAFSSSYVRIRTIRERMDLEAVAEEAARRREARP